jgi:beta-xylosidase
MPSAPKLFRLILGILAMTGLMIVADTTSATASTGTGMFRAGEVWHGQFGTPSVIRVGSTYWAYATTTGGDNLPVLRSTDLRTWVTRSAYPSLNNPGWWAGYNDAMPHPADWALYYIHRNGRSFPSIWGPDVEQVGNHFVLAYAISIDRPGRHCISLGTSSSPAGPFQDHSSRPIVCSSDPNGSIDPQILKTATGGVYLVWKNAGRRGVSPTTIWSRRMTSDGLGFASGSRAHQLLYTARPWEGSVIENPAMIQYGSRWYLFYSGNNMLTSAYATGYALCRGPLGPCRRPNVAGPLLASGRGVVGTGSADPFYGPHGGLRLAYSARDASHPYGSDPVKLHIALLRTDSRGLLHVAYRG